MSARSNNRALAELRRQEQARETMRAISRAMNVPEALVGLPTPRHRRIWQRWTRRPGRYR